MSSDRTIPRSMLRFANFQHLRAINACVNALYRSTSSVCLSKNAGMTTHAVKAIGMGATALHGRTVDKRLNDLSCLTEKSANSQKTTQIAAVFERAARCSRSFAYGTEDVGNLLLRPDFDEGLNRKGKAVVVAAAPSTICKPQANTGAIRIRLAYSCEATSCKVFILASKPCASECFSFGAGREQEEGLEADQPTTPQGS